MSNVRSLHLSDSRILIGENAINKAVEMEAERLVRNEYPDLNIITALDGGKHIPLKEILILERRFSQEKSAIEKDSYERGRQAGYLTGLEEGRREAQQVISSFSGLLADVTNQRQALMIEARERILELVLKISQRLTFGAARVDPEITRSIIAGAIDQLVEKSRIKVKVNPDHLGQLEQYIDKFRDGDTAIREFIIEPDPRVRMGGCFIETPTSNIDARLESMYDIISQSILEGEETSE